MRETPSKAGLLVHGPPAPRHAVHLDVVAGARGLVGGGTAGEDDRDGLARARPRRRRRQRRGREVAHAAVLAIGAILAVAVINFDDLTLAINYVLFDYIVYNG